MQFSDSKLCKYCGVIFYRKTTGTNRNSKESWKKRTFCSVACRVKASVFTGENNPNWRGGARKCIDCSLPISNSSAQRCKPCHYKNISGERSRFWKKDKTLLEAIRQSKAYKLWRTSVYERDNYTCVMCGDEKSRLNADHIYPVAIYPQHAFDINNGRTLCVPCHMKTSTWGVGTLKLKQKYGLQ